jgi:hypothetical protein
MNIENSPGPQEVVEAIKQLAAAPDDASPLNAELLRKWRESVATPSDALLVDNCNEPIG